jgi:hypothetical protein
MTHKCAEKCAPNLASTLQGTTETAQMVVGLPKMAIAPKMPITPIIAPPGQIDRRLRYAKQLESAE